MLDGLPNLAIRGIGLIAELIDALHPGVDTIAQLPDQLRATEEAASSEELVPPVGGQDCLRRKRLALISACLEHARIEP